MGEVLGGNAVSRGGGGNGTHGTNETNRTHGTNGRGGEGCAKAPAGAKARRRRAFVNQ